MRIGIKNKSKDRYCIGPRTEVFLIDTDGRERPLEGITSIDLHIDAEDVVTAKLGALISFLDVGPVKAQLLPGIGYEHTLHNKAEMQRLGLARIN